MSTFADRGYIGKTLPKLGQTLTNYYAIGHASLDNYVAQVSGQAPNVDTQADCQVYADVVPGILLGGQATGLGCVYPASVKTIADQLRAKGLTWKAYMGDMGNTPARDHTDAAGNCGHPAPNSQDHTQTATSADQYASRHDPFVYFHSIIDNATQCANVVPLTRLNHDLSAVATTANYTWITPNLCDDGHDASCVGLNVAGTHAGGFTGIDAFLARYVPMITSSPAFKADGVLLVTFDESDESDAASCCGEVPGPGSPLPGITGSGGGHTPMYVVSPFTKAGSTNATPYNQ